MVIVPPGGDRLLSLGSGAMLFFNFFQISFIVTFSLLIQVLKPDEMHLY